MGPFLSLLLNLSSLHYCEHRSNINLKGLMSIGVIEVRTL